MFESITAYYLDSKSNTVLTRFSKRIQSQRLADWGNRKKPLFDYTPLLCLPNSI